MKTNTEEGICEKIYNAVSPFRGKNNHFNKSHRSTSSTTKMIIPVEHDSTSQSSSSSSPFLHAQRNKKESKTLTPLIHSSLKEDVKENHVVRSFSDTEVPIANNHRKIDQVASTGAVSIQKVKSKKDSHHSHDESMHDGKFSDYISKVKNRMVKAASVSNVGDSDNVNGGGFEKTTTRRDSFNDKMANYIHHAKFKIRTTTTMNVEEKGLITYK